MLSYQHGFHAGNLADVHKHALLSVMLSYLTKKDKPLSYIETHAGRGLYDLKDPKAQKTNEAERGIVKASALFDADHSYSKVRLQITEKYGLNHYPGSPLIAQCLLRNTDKIHLCELHPTEFEHLREAVNGRNITHYKLDGLELAQSLCPPTPRRGLLLIDPPYEIKTDYEKLPKLIPSLQKKWNVGVIALWYPILSSGAHKDMVSKLNRLELPDVLCHEVLFDPAKKTHGMIGSGMFITNTPWGTRIEAERLAESFNAL